MSDVMLHAVLNMPVEMWTGLNLDKILRHSKCVEASERIIEQEKEIEELSYHCASLERWRDETVANGSVFSDAPYQHLEEPRDDSEVENEKNNKR